MFSSSELLLAILAPLPHSPPPPPPQKKNPNFCSLGSKSGHIWLWPSVFGSPYCPPPPAVPLVSSHPHCDLLLFCFLKLINVHNFLSWYTYRASWHTYKVSWIFLSCFGLYSVHMILQTFDPFPPPKPRRADFEDEEREKVSVYTLYNSECGRLW